MSSSRSVLIWAALGIAVAAPIIAAAFSPQLQWRDPVYIASGFAGIIGLALILLQPLLAAGYLPAMTPYQARQLHRWVGAALITSIVIHVGGLWITSPPDVIDALLFNSPTPFSDWGVIAMWAVIVVAVMVALRHRLGLRPRTWRLVHTIFAAVIVVATVIHTLLIEGTMETVTKVLLCALVVAATLIAMIDIRVWRKRAAQPHLHAPESAKSET